MTSQTSPPDYTHDVYLTHQGRLTLTERAEHLRYEVIPHLVGDRDLVDSREKGARDEATAADRATTELAWITTVLATAHPAESIPDDPQVVELGEIVTIDLTGNQAEQYVIVHPCEALIEDGERVSSLSPLGQALLGRRIGDEVDVPAPGGHYRCVIKSATRTGANPKSRRANTSKRRPQT